jgi:hypothetical protein
MDLWENENLRAKTNLESAYELKTPEDLTWWRPHATYLGVALWRLGERDKAEELFTERIRLNQAAIEKGNQNPELPRDMAVILATRGEVEEAVQWMEKAAESGFAWHDLTTKDGLLNNLRDNPRFQQIMAKMKARVASMRSRSEVIEREWSN